MNDMTASECSTLPLATLERIDRICDGFQAAHKLGQRPRIEDYVGQIEAPHRAAFLRDLLAVELHARRRLDEHPEPREYLERFRAPGDLLAIVEAFALSQAEAMRNAM